MKKTDKKVRGKEYYSELLLEIVAKEQPISEKDLMACFEAFDQKYGVRVKKFDTGEMDRLSGKIASILGELWEVEKTKNNSKGLGRKRPIYTYEIKTKDLDLVDKKVAEHFDSLGVKKTTKSICISKRPDKEFRDAYVEMASDLRKADPKLSQIKAIQAAQKACKLDRKKLDLAWRIFQAAANDRNACITSKAIKIMCHNNFRWTNLNALLQIFKYYKLDLQYEQVKTKGNEWNLVFKSLPLAEFKELAKRNDYVIEEKTIDEQVEETKRVEQTILLPKKTGVDLEYLALVAAGMIIRAHRTEISGQEIADVVTKNHYIHMSVSGFDILDLAKIYPQWFMAGKGNTLSLVGTKVWEEINKRFNPNKKTRKQSWCINSGLTIHQVKDLFEDAYIENPSMEIGSKILTFTVSESISDRMKLAELNCRMRDTDFPIACDKDFIKKLNEETGRNKSRLTSYMRKSFAFGIEANDQTLFEIEENLI